MKPGTWDTVFRAIVVLLLLGLTWTGLRGGLHQVSESRMFGEQLQTGAQIAYGLLSLLSVVTTFRGRRWNRLIVATRAVSITLAAGLAAVVWGGTGLVS